MFNKLNGMLAGFNGDVPEQEFEMPLEDTEEINYDEMSPEDVLDSDAPFEVKKEAIQSIKDRYLKPREENEN